MTPYKTRSGLTQYKPSFIDVQSVIEGDEMQGFCLACGAQNGPVEPDARKYTCESCGAPKVYGAEELVLMGLVDTSDDDGDDAGLLTD